MKLTTSLLVFASSASLVLAAPVADGYGSPLVDPVSFRTFNPHKLLGHQLSIGRSSKVNYYRGALRS